MQHTNIITIKGIIISKKARKKENLSESFTDITVLVDVAQTSSLVYFALKY